MFILSLVKAIFNFFIIINNKLKSIEFILYVNKLKSFKHKI